MKKVKRIAAVLGVILLVGMYVLTFISGILATPQTGNLFRACIYCTITVPCLLYGFELIYRILKKKDSSKEDKKV
jgi:4-hydroxybenzoate polyprenyltransferase